MAFQFGTDRADFGKSATLPGGTTGWVDGNDLPAFFEILKVFPKSKPVTMVTFNSLFDMSITAWRYGYVPDLMIDVLGMARALYGPALANKSLASLSAYLKLPVQKGHMPHVAGMRTEEIKANPALWDAFVSYAKQDISATVGAYQHMLPEFPQQEFLTMDLVLRTAIQPQFQFNCELLESHLEDLKKQKEELLAAAGLQYDEDGRIPELMSAAKFKALLEGMGVVVEEKVSPITGRALPALAKTDEFMQGLLEHEDPAVALLAAARLGHKSTIEETRTQRYISVSKLTGPHWTPGAAPMPLRYGAAHTHRLGGDWLMNVQNMPAGRAGQTNKIRQSIEPLP